MQYQIEKEAIIDCNDLLDKKMDSMLQVNVLVTFDKCPFILVDKNRSRCMYVSKPAFSSSDYIDNKCTPWNIEICVLQSFVKQAVTEINKKDFGGFPSYQEYLNSERWMDFRSIILNYYGHKCMLCSVSTNLNVHHNNYDNLGRETMADVIVLCRDCHARHHQKGHKSQ